MSNNIYDILKKIESLEAPKKTNLTESKSMDKKKEDKKHESKKKDKADKGAIAEAVARVEKQLSEKFHDHKKTMQESEVEESGLQAYLGKKKYGETGMKALQKAGREGASKEKMAMIRAKHNKMDEGLDIDDRIENLKGAIKDETPRSKPGEDHKEQYARHAKKIEGYKAELKKLLAQKKLQEGEYNEDMLSPKQKSFAALAEPKDKITYADKIAGAKKGKKDEGNEFSGELVKARAQGKDSFEVDGKSYPVKEGELSAKEKWMNPDNTFKNPKTDAEWARIHKSRRDYEADLAKDGIKPPPWHLKSDDDAALNKARSQDQTDRDADRSMLNRLGNYGSRLFFGRDMPVNEGGKTMREGWEEMQKYLEKKRGPESKGGAGKKAGTRYGGSAQKDDDDEETDGEGKPVEKKRGRPKGTGGGAKFSFKKPKD